MNIQPTAKVGLPVLGPLALHFLRPNSRIINDNMEAMPENILSKVFSDTTNIGNPNLGACAAVSSSTKNSTCITSTLGPFTHSLDFKRDYLGQFNSWCI
jgi:hypothetical protein